MMPDLEGKWKGELIYGPGYGNIAQETLFFEMTLACTGQQFKGISSDVDGIGLNPADAKVRGFLNDDGLINFVREYGANSRSGASQPVFKEKAEITFSGFYNAAANEFEGEWLSLADFMTFNNNIPGVIRGGSWRMRKMI